MAYSQDLKNGKTSPITAICVAGVTPEIDLEGGTLCGVFIEAEVTSTYFTISAARVSGGTFCTIVDPDAAGADKQFFVGATSDDGYVPISPLLTAGLRFIKINFDQSETPTIYIARRNMN